MQLKETFRTMVPIKANDAGQLPSKIQIMPLGIWDSPTHGEFSILPSDCMEFIENFENGKYRAGDSLPIDLDHDGGEAAGWINALELVNDGSSSQQNGLWASVEWTPLGKEKINSKQYKFFSPEFAPVYMAPQDGSLASNVLIGGGLVNRPFFKDMTPVTASEKNREQPATLFFIETTPNPAPMNTEEILAKPEADRTQEERDFLAANPPAPVEPAAPTEPVEPVAPVAPVAPVEPVAPTQPVVEPTAPIEASEKAITITAAEKADLDARILAGEKAQKELRTMKFSEKIKGLSFDEAKGKGKFPATSTIHEKLLDLYISCNDSVAAKLDAFLASLPDVALFSEVGTGDDTGTQNPSEKISKLASERYEKALAEGTLGTRQFSDFRKEVRTELPGLATEEDEQEKTRMHSIRS